MDEDPAPERIPHHRIIVGVTFFVLFAFTGVTAWVLVYVNDETIKGSVIGTWTAMATSASAFWLGSSMAGKMKK